MRGVRDQGELASFSPRVGLAGAEVFERVAAEPLDRISMNDTDLRELVGRLCEAELVCRGLSPAAVTWGPESSEPARRRNDVDRRGLYPVSVQVPIPLTLVE